ncbi:MAG: dihydrolipoyl dehydrogenase [Actinomycetes bacterium]
MPEQEDFDLVVVGGGPGGYAAALRAAGAGLSVALVEQDRVGGTCLHRGCIPAKELLEAAHVWQTVQTASAFGINFNEAPSMDFAANQGRKREVIEMLFKGLSGLLDKRSVSIFGGRGQLTGSHEVTVTADGTEVAKLKGRYIILASGSRPRTLGSLVIDGKVVVTSDEFLEIERLPKSAAVIGAGAIGCEFASLLSDLGVKVSLIESLDRLLAGCDKDISATVARSFKKRKISILTGTQVTGHELLADGTGAHLNFSEGDGIDVELVVVSVGREACTSGLVADGLAIVLDPAGAIAVDEFQQTAIPDVYAVGDVVAGSPQLAHVGFAEALVAVGRILGEEVEPVNYERVPWAIYCQPEVAFAGLSEEEAVDRGIAVVVSKDTFMGNGRARIIGHTDGLVKIVAQANSDGSAGQVLGVHLCGPWVTEQLSGGYFAVNWEASATQLAGLIQPHPSLSESFGEAALALVGRGLHLA